MTEHLPDGLAWLDDRQAGALLGLRRKRIHALRADHSGSFPRARVTTGGGLSWSRSELEVWAGGQGIAPSTKALPRTVSHQQRRRVTSRSKEALLPLLAVVAVMVVSALMYRQRLSDHVTNVDDYLYARQTSTFLDSITSNGTGVLDAWREFGINSPLVPMLAAPLAAGDPTPAHLVLVQFPLVAGLVVALGVLLGRCGMGRARWPLAALISVAPPVLTYTAMLSFSIAATLGVVASLLAYLASRRLRSRPAAVWLGVALGLLSLSRVVALVYLAALLVPMAVDLVLDREAVAERARNAAITVAVAGVIAAPWWLTAGPKALNYLLDAGYSSNSVFTNDQTLPQKIEDRLTRSADETGWLLALAVLVVFLIGVSLAALRARTQPTEQVRGVLVGGSACLLGMLLLGSSSNAGTAFALPFVVLAAGLGVAGIALELDGRWLPVRVVLSAAVASGLALSTFAVLQPADPATWGTRQLWISGTPARAQVESALGCTDCTLPNGERLNTAVYNRIKGDTTVILRADAVVNPESLRFLGEQADVPVNLTAPAGSVLDSGTLAGAKFALSGRTAAPYLGVDLPAADAALRAAGFCPVLERTLSPLNQITLWRDFRGLRSC